MKPRALIIDDEELARRRISRMLQLHAMDIEVIAEADNGLVARTLINDLRPDIVFIDVMMPGLTGIEVANTIDYIPYIVFVTGDSHAVLESFVLRDFDYLPKPVDADALGGAISRFKLNGFGRKTVREN